MLLNVFESYGSVLQTDTLFAGNQFIYKNFQRIILTYSCIICIELKISIKIKQKKQGNKYFKNSLAESLIEINWYRKHAFICYLNMALHDLGSNDVDVTAFLNEALIMKDFNHPNVLTLIGITLDKGEFPMVILPFMQNGSLLSYIRNENNVGLMNVRQFDCTTDIIHDV